MEKDRWQKHCVYFIHRGSSGEPYQCIFLLMQRYNSSAPEPVSIFSYSAVLEKTGNLPGLLRPDFFHKRLKRIIKILIYIK